MLPLGVATARAVRHARRAAARQAHAEAALRQARVDVDRLGPERDRALAESERLRADRASERKQLDQVRQALAHHQDLLQRVRRSWRAEREWSTELRGQIQHLYDTRGVLGEESDVRALVLEAAIKLTESEKGLLMSRGDADGDGDLDAVLARGFEHDPEHSALVQRFARGTLAREQIVREDDPQVSAGVRPTAADEEIDALVVIPLYLRDRFDGVVICANRPGGFDEVDDGTLLALGDHAGSSLHQARLRSDQRRTELGAVRALLEADAGRDVTLHLESVELARHAAGLAADLGWSEPERDVLLGATLLRGVGYLGLDDRRLRAQGPLGPQDRAAIELHPLVGYRIIGQLPELRDVALAVLHHHERIDGGGYPSGLMDERIPQAARALAVLEAYGAITHHRPYRLARSPEVACEELMAGAGTQFDRRIVERFVERVRADPRPPLDEVADEVLQALLPDAAAREEGLPGDRPPAG